MTPNGLKSSSTIGTRKSFRSFMSGHTSCSSHPYGRRYTPGHHRSNDRGDTALANAHLVNNIRSGGDTHHGATLIADNDKIDVSATRQPPCGRHAPTIHRRNRNMILVEKIVPVARERLVTVRSTAKSLTRVSCL